MYLSLDRNLVDGDKVVRSSCFSAYCDSGRGCHSVVLRGDHHCDVVWWSRWSELSGAARDVVDVVGARRSRPRRGRRELGGAARDVVDVVRGRLDMACSWFDVAHLAACLARRGSLSGSTRLNTACLMM